MGLGKTAQALWYYKVFVKTGKMLVVCPKSIKLNWQHEALKHIGLRAEVLESHKVPRTLPKADIYVINYDVLQSWVPLFKKYKFTMLVPDECHMIKEPTAKRTKAVKELSRGIPHMVALSGTPLTNRPRELWPVLNMLRPELWPTFFPFGNRYCGPKITPWGKKYDGATNIAELHQILKSEVMIRRRKRDVLKDLPPMQWITLPIELNDFPTYQKAERDIIAWLQQTRPERANRARRAERLAKLIYLRQLVGQLKLPTLKEWITNFRAESRKKLLTFGIHIDFLDELTEFYGNRAVKVMGKVTGKKRQLAFDSFVHSKNVDFLFGNIQAAGVGWNAPGVQDVMIAEFPWTPGELDQAAARVHGLGRGVQGKRSNIYMMAAVNTIDTFMCGTLTTKRKVLGQTLDGDTPEEEVKMFDALENYLLDKGKR